MNSLNMIGRLIADPDFKVVKEKELTTFTLAVDDRFSDHTSFIDCQAWGKTAETIANHCHKGKQIGVTGRIRQERWENDEGQKRSRVLMVVEKFTFTSKKDE